MKQKVTVFGSFVVDLMARTPHLPAPAETVKGSFFKQGAGGKGFNQGVAAHKAGGDVAMITKLGRDSMANVALDVMTELNMPKDFLFYNDDVATGIALIMVDENSSQNEIVIVPGACGTITAEDIKSVEQRICDSAYILLQLEVNQDANEAVAKLAKCNVSDAASTFNKCLWLHKQKIKSHHSSTRSAISLASLTASAS